VVVTVVAVEAGIAAVAAAWQSNVAAVVAALQSHDVWHSTRDVGCSHRLVHRSRSVVLPLVAAAHRGVRFGT